MSMRCVLPCVAAVSRARGAAPLRPGAGVPTMPGLLSHSPVADAVMTPVSRKIHRGLTLFALLALAACASTPPPTADVARAEAAVVGASRADAEQHAEADLAAARQRLEIAQRLLADGDNDGALAMARQAEAAADLASARSRHAVARAALERRTRENAQLRRELEETR